MKLNVSFLLGLLWDKTCLVTRGVSDIAFYISEAPSCTALMRDAGCSMWSPTCIQLRQELKEERWKMRRDQELAEAHLEILALQEEERKQEKQRKLQAEQAYKAHL